MNPHVTKDKGETLENIFESKRAQNLLIMAHEFKGSIKLYNE